MTEMWDFGQTADGQVVTACAMTNPQGMTVTILSLGAIIQSIILPDENGTPLDVVLGYDSVAEYEQGEGYIGALIGRHANRLGGAFIEIDGTKYDVTANEGKNQLHGGAVGFDKKVFDLLVPDEEKNVAVLRCTSADGEEGFPGRLELSVTYTLSDDNALLITYEAVSNKDTVCNITNHSYFNLNGAGSGTAMNHTLQLVAKSFTENDADSLPTGRILPVEGTPMDFKSPKALGQDISADYEPLRLANGYDHNFVLDKAEGALAAVALLEGDKSGLRLVCATTCPGLQLYTANFLKENLSGKEGKTYAPRHAVCLETQYFPNSMNCPDFCRPILRAGEPYKETTIYQFG